jgi:hypothetical protein
MLTSTIRKLKNFILVICENKSFLLLTCNEGILAQTLEEENMKEGALFSFMAKIISSFLFTIISSPTTLRMWF